MHTHNAAGRLVRAETITATQVYTYNGDGLLVAQSIDGVETSFTWDSVLRPTGLGRCRGAAWGDCGVWEESWGTSGRSRSPQVLATSDGVKTLYGLERLAVFEGGAWHYPQHDAIGSVRQWTDATAAVLATQSYSPFGVPQTPLGPAPWGFTGEWHDPGGLVWCGGPHVVIDNAASPGARGGCARGRGAPTPPGEMVQSLLGPVYAGGSAPWDVRDPGHAASLRVWTEQPNQLL